MAKKSLDVMSWWLDISDNFAVATVSGVIGGLLVLYMTGHLPLTLLIQNLIVGVIIFWLLMHILYSLRKKLSD